MQNTLSTLYTPIWLIVHKLYPCPTQSFSFLPTTSHQKVYPLLTLKILILKSFKFLYWKNCFAIWFLNASWIINSEFLTELIGECQLRLSKLPVFPKQFVLKAIYIYCFNLPLSTDFLIQCNLSPASSSISLAAPSRFHHWSLFCLSFQV